jgi:MFS transporter, putative metabolite:H+ symporter
LGTSAPKPWWAWIFFYSPVPPGITAQQWVMLGALGATYLINSYDLGVLNLALPQIQESFELSEEDVGKLAAVVRLGVLPALALNVIADRVGRRRLLLLTIYGFTLCTFLTAFVRTPYEFAVLQLLARTFVYTEEMLAIVVVTEVLAPHARGWGIGLMIAFGALGHGLSAVAFSLVEVLPFGWRALYVVGIVPLLVIAWLRRSLEETERFRVSAERRGATTQPWLAPLKLLLTRYPGRLAALCFAVLPVSFATGTAIQFQSKHLQQVHGYAPSDVSALLLLGGPVAIMGGLLFGRASDRFGRRRVLSVAITASVVSTIAFYNGSGALLPLFWVVAIFSNFGMDVLFSALGSELFATAYRSTASGLRSIFSTVAIAAGLAVEGTLYLALGSHAAAITAMAWCALAGPVILLAFVPETAQRELEEIAPDED